MMKTTLVYVTLAADRRGNN